MSEETKMPKAEDLAAPIPPMLEVEGRPTVRGFEWQPRGLFYLKPDGKDSDQNEKPPVPVWIAPLFTLPGLVRDENSQGWCLLIAWTDPDGNPHEAAIPFEMMSGEGADLARTLAQGGMVLNPEPGLRKFVLRYLCSAYQKIKARVRQVKTTGWHDGAFVLPTGETIGHGDELVRFAGELAGLPGRACRGTLQGWQEGVAGYAVNNPMLAFAISSAFSGPLLDLVRPDGGGGYNLQGASSRGKTTCLEGAASVWGKPDPLLTWRATSNGLEGIAAARNDGFLALDEMSQVEPKEAGSIAYMLSNGSPKVRGAKDGGTRAMWQWRLIFLSTGEQTLEDKLGEDGKRTRAGQEVRVPDVPCPAGGMFADAHGLPGFAEFAEHLKAQARKHYGHAARVFLDHLCREWEHRDALQTRLREAAESWILCSLPLRADAQVRRVAGRFALVAVAGELAREWGILPWEAGEADRAAKICFDAWLERRGHATEAAETHKGIAAVLAFLERHGQSRFDVWDDATAKDKYDANGRLLPRPPRVINRAGTRKQSEVGDTWDFYITADGWKEACEGFNPRSVAQACEAAGILEKSLAGKFSQSKTIPGYGKGRYYIIEASAIEAHQGAA